MKKAFEDARIELIYLADIIITSAGSEETEEEGPGSELGL